jgi:hypothetical protein
LKVPTPLISNVLSETESKETRKEKINYLQKHRDNKVLRELLRYVFDSEVTFALPEGSPPYEPNQFAEPHDSGLYRELRKFYLFIEPVNPNVHQVKRESLFIDLLESLHPDEAKLVCAVKDKKLPYKGITKKLVKDAFPDLSI